MAIKVTPDNIDSTLYLNIKSVFVNSEGGLSFQVNLFNSEEDRVVGKSVRASFTRSLPLLEGTEDEILTACYAKLKEEIIPEIRVDC